MYKKSMNQKVGSSNLLAHTHKKALREISRCFFSGFVEAHYYQSKSLIISEENEVGSDKLYIFQLAIAENTINIILKIGRDTHVLQILTANKGIITNASHSCWDFNLSEAGTAGECAVSNGSHTLRESDGGEAFAFAEGFISYFDDTIRQSN